MKKLMKNVVLTSGCMFDSTLSSGAGTCSTRGKSSDPKPSSSIPSTKVSIKGLQSKPKIINEQKSYSKIKENISWLSKEFKKKEQALEFEYQIRKDMLNKKFKIRE